MSQFDPDNDDIPEKPFPLDDVESTQRSPTWDENEDEDGYPADFPKHAKRNENDSLGWDGAAAILGLIGIITSCLPCIPIIALVTSVAAVLMGIRAIFGDGEDKYVGGCMGVVLGGLGVIAVVGMAVAAWVMWPS